MNKCIICGGSIPSQSHNDTCSGRCFLEAVKREQRKVKSEFIDITPMVIL